MQSKPLRLPCTTSAVSPGAQSQVAHVADLLLHRRRPVGSDLHESSHGRLSTQPSPPRRWLLPAVSDTCLPAPSSDEGVHHIKQQVCSAIALQQCGAPLMTCSCIRSEVQKHSQCRRCRRCCRSTPTRSSPRWGCASRRRHRLGSAGTSQRCSFAAAAGAQYSEMQWHPTVVRFTMSETTWRAQSHALDTQYALHSHVPASHEVDCQVSRSAPAPCSWGWPWRSGCGSPSCSRRTRRSQWGTPGSPSRCRSPVSEHRAWLRGTRVRRQSNPLSTMINTNAYCCQTSCGQAPA
jgi:hypothetical protein